MALRAEEESGLVLGAESAWALSLGCVRWRQKSLEESQARQRHIGAG